MAGEVDREGGQTQRQDRRVPGVGVEARAVDKGDHWRCVTEAEGAQGASVVESEGNALDRWEIACHSDAASVSGQKPELIVGRGHRCPSSAAWAWLGQ